jgi:hypothetical protein
LGNASAEAGGLFNEENLEPGIRQVEGSPHSTDAAANNHGRSDCCAMGLPLAKDVHRAPPPLPDFSATVFAPLGCFHYKRVVN